MRARHAQVALVAALIALSASGCGAISTGYGKSTTGNVGQTGGTGGGTGGSTGGGTTGNVGQSPAGGSDNQCVGEFNPLPSGIAPGASVKASLLTRCSTPPKQHHLTMYLQRWVNGEWQDQNSKTIDRIPGPQDIIPNLVTAPCVPGKWQLVISIDGISGDGIPWHVDETSATREISPNECS